MSQINTVKDEMTFIINSKLGTSSRSTRDILGQFPFLNAMLLNRLTHYKVEDIKIDKLMLIINQIDEQVHNKVFGFDVNVNTSEFKISLTYQGQLQAA